MKKTMKCKTILALSLLLCMMLTACEEQTEISTTSSDNSTESQASTESNIDTGFDLNLVVNSSITMGMVSGSENGAYVLSKETTGAALQYYDYVSQNYVYLTNQVEPTWDEQNPGWIENVEGGAVPIVAGDKLYVVAFGMAAIPELNLDGSRACVYQMDFNGMNRKKLEFTDNQTINLSSCVAADGADLLIMVNNYNDETGRCEGTSLCRVDFESNLISELISFDTTGNTRDVLIVSVWDEGVIFMQQEIPDEMIGRPLREVMEHITYKLVRYSLKDGQMTELLEFVPGDRSYVLSREMMYYFESDNYACVNPVIYAQNLISGEIQEIGNIDALAGDLYDYDSWYITSRPIDNHLTFLLYNSVTSEGWTCALDLNSKEFTELTLGYTEYGNLYLMEIYAESDKEFLIKTGDVEYTYSVDGMNEQVRIVPVFQLISKEDYWHSIPNFISFNDLILPDDAYSISQIIT